MAGTIGAKTNNGIGVAGVAGGNWQAGLPGVSLMHGVVFGVNETGAPRQGGFAESLAYAANNGARISCNSWGAIVPNVFNLPVLEAIDYCTQVMDMLVVFAAGNSGSQQAFYPGYYSQTIAVAATNNRKEAPLFTNFGTWVDIAAPGVNILSTVIQNSYGNKSGTSFACPQIAAILALGWTMKPHATADELKTCLFQTADDLDKYQPFRISGFLEGKLGAGLVNAYEFLKCVSYPAAMCGNGHLDNDELEECDGNDFGTDDSCEMRGFYYGGNLTCTPDCKVHTDNCYKLVYTTGWFHLRPGFTYEGEFTVNWPADVVQFELSAYQGDADLYVHRGTTAPDSLSMYDCKSEGFTSEEVCSFYQENANGTYQFFVRGFTSSDRIELIVFF